jgi:flavin reductase (DIM6/NTAB) family NADH-FMN oxidoreductase RutF
LKEINPSKVHRFFYPDVPAILCASHSDRVSAMPVVSYASISEDPPLVAVSCNPGATTYRTVMKSRLFSLCFLDRSRASAVEYLATHSGRTTRDKLLDAGLEHGRGLRLDVPIIENCVASLECTLSAKRKFGDHVLIVGTVEAALASDDFDEYWRFVDYRPILYTGWQGKLTMLDS